MLIDDGDFQFDLPVAKDCGIERLFLVMKLPQISVFVNSEWKEGRSDVLLIAVTKSEPSLGFGGPKIAYKSSLCSAAGTEYWYLNASRTLPVYASAS